MPQKKASYYAVAKGKESDKVVETWDECKLLVNGFKGAIYKKFTDLSDAHKFLEDSKNSQVNTKITEQIKRNSRIPNEETQTIIIYTDGSLVRRQGEVYSGYGIYMPGKNIELSEVLYGTKTNNRAELTAIIKSIRMFNEEDNTLLHIYTDSQYSIGIFGDTGLKYRSKNYMKKTNQEVPNADLVKIAVELADKYLLQFTHINSHTSLDDEHSKGNDRADTLAVRGAVTDYTSRCSSLGNSVLTFGKYKNHYIKNIPTSYLSWIITSESFENLCVKNEDRRLEKEIVLSFMESLSQ